jgi:hypothetical protein
MAMTANCFPLSLKNLEPLIPMPMLQEPLHSTQSINGVSIIVQIHRSNRYNGEPRKFHNKNLRRENLKFIKLVIIILKVDGYVLILLCYSMWSHYVCNGLGR